MSGKMGMGLVCFALASWLVVNLDAPATAQKAFLGVARSQYSVAENAAKCTLCHEARKGPSRKTLNTFGKALQSDKNMTPVLGKNSSYTFSADDLASVGKALTDLDEQDSDGDGATNKEELALGTIPGDATSKPDAKALEALRKAAAEAKAKAETKKGEKK